MNTISSLITGIYIILAALQTFVAPKIRPNPYFGLKIGYTFSSREVWEKSNRRVGLLMLLHSFILIPFCFLNNSYFLYYILAFIAPLVAISIYGIIYSSHLLEEVKGEKISTEPIKPLEVSFVWKHLGLLLFLVLLFLMAITYNFLPQTIAVHFNSAGEPNGWSSKFTFVIGYAGFGLVYLAILYLIVYAGKKYPMLVHSGKMKIGRDTVFKSALLAMNLVMLILIITYIAILLYNTSSSKNSNLINMAVAISLILAFTPILYIIYRWRKEVIK